MKIPITPFASHPMADTYIPLMLSPFSPTKHSLPLLIFLLRPVLSFNWLLSSFSTTISSPSFTSFPFYAVNPLFFLPTSNRLPFFFFFLLFYPSSPVLLRLSFFPLLLTPFAFTISSPPFTPTSLSYYYHFHLLLFFYLLFLIQTPFIRRFPC